jgi:hypothetical protein
MIANEIEYRHAQEEIQYLEARLRKLQEQHAFGEKGLTKAGIRKMIARLHEELGVFEGSEEVRLERIKLVPETK